MYLFRATNCTYYTRMVLPVYLRDKGFSADIKISLLTKQRSIAIGRNLIVAGILRPLISNLTPQSMPDAFKAHVNQLINDARAGFIGVTDTLDDKAKPVREVTAFIPMRPIQFTSADDNPSPQTTLALSNNAGSKNQTKSVGNITLQDALTKFITSKQKQSISALTVKQLNQRISHFIERTHLEDVVDITSAEAMEYKDCLLEEGRSHKSNKDYLAAVSQFFKWSRLMQYTSANPFDEVTLSKPSNLAGQDLARQRWQPHQLKHVLQSQDFIDKHPDFKWITLLMLYHGLRPSEACQLHSHDITDIDGLAVIHVTNEGITQQLKTAQSKRTVPLHKKLIELGFIDFVKSLTDRTSKNKPLFGYPPSSDGVWSHKFCREFCKLLGQLNFIAGKRPTAYSFRHTFIDELKQLQIEESMVAQIVGHAYHNITYGRYGKQYDVKTLKPVVDKVEFALNLSQII
ncbi:tyrosine-type recombinase/integrase [Shewanella glacialipiscicola]|uniref:Integrase n=3 Tax=Shewanella glacialipiscicola TaxID=614069 RepID=A0ABQ6J0N9_9GAMM|nr:tyrosine-type recombinase/integrase [Shewanella glacialipiscicola]GIU06632.1 integrase [Shewanella glacialipiscicola]GMA81701.1 integrase [Shewanella glacialipiscicola]GMA84573.1 integrase [Shewanella glacialipiscicola]GMA84646.1 integrase [Shewanella glacialipiscicola]